MPAFAAPAPHEKAALLLELIMNDDARTEIEDEIIAACVDHIDAEEVWRMIEDMWDEPDAQARFVQQSYSQLELAEQDEASWRDALTEMIGVRLLHEDASAADRCRPLLAQLPRQMAEDFAQWLSEIYRDEWAAAHAPGEPVADYVLAQTGLVEMIVACDYHADAPLPSWWGFPN